MRPSGRVTGGRTTRRAPTMLLYAFRRVLLAAVIVSAATLVLFSLLHLMPGDPVSIALGPRATPEVQARYIEKMGMDRPVYVQFFRFAGNVLRGDLGVDVFSERSVARTVLDQLRYTLALAAAGLSWAVLLGVPLGCLAATRPGTWLDRVTGVLSIGTIAVPSFLVSIWSLLAFGLALRWFPIIGAGDEDRPLDQLHHLVLPAFAVGLGWVGYLARMVRASMLEVMGETWIRAARSYGLPQRKVVYGYALRVAVLPAITLVGMGFGGLLSSAVFAEIIFSRPGVGKLIFDMVMVRNFPVVQGAVLVTTVLYVFIVLAADLVVAALDPRVRQSL